MKLAVSPVVSRLTTPRDLTLKLKQQKSPRRFGIHIYYIISFKNSVYLFAKGIFVFECVPGLNVVYFLHETIAFISEKFSQLKKDSSFITVVQLSKTVPSKYLKSTTDDIKLSLPL